MQSKAFSRFILRCQKMALATKEDIDINDFITVRAKDIVIEKEPFPHIVIDNFFKPDIYKALCDQFDEIKARGLSDEKHGEYSKFHAFNMDYDGYLYIPSATLDPKNPRSLFYSLEWNFFFSKLFKQVTSFETTFALHHHPPGDKTGFVHHDFSDKQFANRAFLPNGVISAERDGSAVQRRRVISLLIYLNNEEWRDGDGGETGIYNKDGTQLLKKIPPINNRLFAFQTSPVSMHAFQSNKKARNCIVQWFHIPLELI